MKQTFEIRNVKCGGCAATLKKELAKEFGEIEVNLEVEPRQITLEIEDEKIESLKFKLRSLGYPLTSDTLTTFQNIGTTAKSFVSCAIGKMENDKS
ncbi:MAG: heavy-metal-associated domain-containing protein [Campylobacterales bacterium]|nr:heavy-metal-associated domain-containing protein [Campylobacterales bacterium]